VTPANVRTVSAAKDAPASFTALRFDTTKRVVDLVLAIGGMVFFAPAMFLIVLAIRLENRGSILYRQQRVGRYGEPFTMLKFRTMVENAPDIPTDQMQQHGEVYVTRVGRILRKTSLDELPQFWNIIRGEMSFVGPRPALHNQYELIAMREQTHANCVRPGITGLAQVNGRDDIDDVTKVAYDQQYVESRCARLDARIFLKTIFAVATSRGNR
jgi:O-antigen biosynthesis protein WbqP